MEVYDRLSELKKKYEISEEQLKLITKTIIQVLKNGHLPTENPIAIVVGGQSGAGKSGLMAYSSNQLPSAVMIDNDVIRSFHPYSDEIKRLYPKYYTELTDQLGIAIIPEILDYFMGNNIEGAKYDIIFHQTLKNNTIVDNAITNLIKEDYLVNVKVLAVCGEESLMSQVERCEEQYNLTGCCRYVSSAAHKQAVEGVPNTIGYMEDSFKYDVIEVFLRGSEINKPNLVYAKVNPLNKVFVTRRAKERDFNVSIVDVNQVGYVDSAKEAIIKCRERDRERCMNSFPDRLNKIRANGSDHIPGMKIYVDELDSLMKLYTNAKTETRSNNQFWTRIRTHWNDTRSM